MQRIFTKDIGRFKAGEVRDYWKPTWTAIERSAKMALEKFSKPYEEAAQEGAKRK